MKLIVWNTFGAKWDTAWGFTSPYVPAFPNDDVFVLLVEAGWAPWVRTQNVICNGWYDSHSDKEWFDKASWGTSLFCQAVASRRQNAGFWVPWAKSLDGGRTNSRCSLGCGIFPMQFITKRDCLQFNDCIRPILRLRVCRGGTEDTLFTIFLVHMVSGNQQKAEDQLIEIMNVMTQNVPQGRPAIIVGDMNVNLMGLTFTTPLPSYWSILNTGVPTQQSGGELDYGLLYDPTGHYSGSTVGVLKKFKTGNNTSDHSVLLFDIPLK